MKLTMYSSRLWRCLVGFYILLFQFSVIQPARTEEPKASKEQAKFALLVGINDYSSIAKNAGRKAENNNLNGCTEDVNDVKNLLVKSFGFKSECIKTLTDTEATANAIVTAFKSQLIENAKTHKNGVFVFHFSGHGATGLPDYNHDEPDGNDECIVAADSQPIVDDQIACLTKQLTDAAGPDANISFIFDCCHSGSTNRLPLNIKYRQLKVEDLDLSGLREQEQTANASDETGSESNSILPPSKNFVMISACSTAEQEPETSKRDGKTRGVLTTFLTEILSSNRSGCSYRDLKERLTAAITATYGTHPQVLGDIDRAVFSDDGLRADPFVGILESNGSQIKINAGQAHGVQPGGVVAVYSKDRKKLSGNIGLLCQGTVRSVDALTAVVDLEKAVPAESKVRIVTYNFGSAPLAVAFDLSMDKSHGQEFFDELSKTIEDSKIFKIVSKTYSDRSPDQWDVKIVADRFDQFVAGAQRSGGASSATGGEPKGDEIVYFIVSRDEQPLFNFWVRPGDRGAKSQLSEVLYKRAQQQSVLALQNSADSSLRNAIDLKIVRVLEFDEKEDGSVVAKKVERRESDQLGQCTFKPGDKFYLDLKNKTANPLWVNILAVDTAGTIAQLYPVPGDQESLTANGTVKTQILEASGPRGIDTYKVIVTNGPSDFSFLQQEGMGTRGANPKSNSGLAQLLFKGTTRSTRFVTVPVPDQWGVMTFESAVSDKH